MADIKLAFGTKTTITVTLTSLTNGSARESTAIDNTSNKFIDAIVRVQSKGQASGTLLLDVYVYFALGDTTYTDGATGTDAAFTAANRRNSPYIKSIQLNAATSQEKGGFSIAKALDGVMPDKWGLIFVNSSGATLSATGGDHVVEFEGISATSV